MRVMDASMDGDDVMKNAIRHSPLSIVLTDPRIKDNPITYVNSAFEALTLYSRRYAVGRNCRFLQGPETEERHVTRIRDGLKSEQEFEVTLTNYRADGSAFRNQLLIAPIHGEDGELTAFFGLQREVPDPAGAAEGDDASMGLLRELQHRVKNHLSMIVSMIRIQARQNVTEDSLKAIGRRIEALSVLYDELLSGGGTGASEEIATGAYLSRIASVVSSLEPRGAIRVNVECDEISLPVDQAARLGLLLSEFMTNAFEHAFEGRSSGTLEVRFARREDGGVYLMVEDDGNGLPENSNWPFSAPSIAAQKNRAEHHDGALDTTGEDGKPGVGGSIVQALTQSLDAELSVERLEQGTRVTVEL
ncbi:PAS domain-containing protein [Roseovarius confluentis]|uniref:PAS domain-containing protein n=1 Tax=Roseovarius confluentis TaxID=1852027 RepID=UPI000CDDC631|nr:PAS domain-containing protein [Roseovarius confluentis]